MHDDAKSVGISGLTLPAQSGQVQAYIVIQLRFFLAAYLLINANFWKQAG